MRRAGAMFVDTRVMPLRSRLGARLGTTPYYNPQQTIEQERLESLRIPLNRPEVPN